MKKIFGSLLVILLGCFVWAGTAGAAQFTTGETVESSTGKPVNDNLFVAASNIIINDDIAGDLVAFGSKVEINGNVGGNLITAGQNVTIKGKVARDIFAAGQDISLAETSKVGGDVFLAGDNIKLDGEIGGYAKLAASSIAFNGIIGKDVRADLGDATVGDATQINGAVNYHAKNQIAALTSDKIKGTVNFVPVSTRPVIQTNFGSWFFGMMALLIFSFILIWLAPKYTNSLGEMTWLDFWLGIVWGLVTVLVLPILTIILLVSVVGIPIAVLAGFLLFVMFYLARLPFAMWLGKILLPKGNIYLQLLIGVLIVSVIFALPLIGTTIQTIAVISGAGIVLHKMVKLEKELLKKKEI